MVIISDVQGILPATARLDVATIRDQVTDFALPYRQYPWTTCHHTSSEAGTGLMPFGCLFRNGSTRRRSGQICLLDFSSTPHGSSLRQVRCTANEATCCASESANHSCFPAAHPFTAGGCLCAPWPAAIYPTKRLVHARHSSLRQLNLPCTVLSPTLNRYFDTAYRILDYYRQAAPASKTYDTHGGGAVRPGNDGAPPGRNTWHER